MFILAFEKAVNNLNAKRSKIQPDSIFTWPPPLKVAERVIEKNYKFQQV